MSLHRCDNRLHTGAMPQGRIGRASRIAGVGAGHAARTARARLTPGEARRAEALKRSHMETADRLVTVLGSMKGAAMKLGQTFSVIDVGMVPEEFREEFQAKLAKLQAAAEPRPFKDMKKVVEQDLGAKLGSVFSDFDEEPIAAASIGQVYRATLQGRGRRRRGQGPVPGRQGHGPRRPAEPRAGAEDPRPHLAGPGLTRDRRGGPRAHHRGARLRARGRQPPCARPGVPRPPVRRRSRGLHRALPRARDRHRVRARASASPGCRNSPRTRATSTRRSSSASTATGRSGTACSTATRIRATRCSCPTGASPSWTSASSSA